MAKKKKNVEEQNIDASVAIEEMKKVSADTTEEVVKVAEESEPIAVEEKVTEPEPVKEEPTIIEEKVAEPVVVEKKKVTAPKPVVAKTATKKNVKVNNRRRLTAMEAYGRYAFGLISD